MKPEYNAGKNLKEQMDAAVILYKDEMTLQVIADALSINPIKVRKLLITAGVYESDTAKLVQQTFNTFRETQDYSTAVTSTMSALQLSRPSVTSYLPYEKGVYFPETAEAENISAGAERQRHYRAVVALKKNPCEELQNQKYGEAVYKRKKKMIYSIGVICLCLIALLTRVNKKKMIIGAFFFLS